MTDTEITEVNNALAKLEESLEKLKIQLTPEERMRYGRINEQNKLFVNKVNDYATLNASLKSPEIDWDEFARDFKSRAVLEGFMERLSALTLRVQNAKTLHDYDNYQEALADYAYTTYRAGLGGADFEKKAKELKQFFARSRKKEVLNDTEQPSATSE